MLGTAECSDIYPDEIELFESGTYEGRKGEAGGEFTLWDAGEYEVLSEDRIKISTANDAEIVYRFAISHDRLTFVDEDGCEFKYRRVE